MTVKDKVVVGNRDFKDQILKNWGLQVLASDPGTTYARIYYNSTTFKVRYYDTNAAAWADFGSGGGFITAVSDTTEVDLTVTGTTLSADLKAGSVALSRLVNIAADTIVGRANGAGTGAPTALTVAQIKTILALSAADISGFDTQVRTNRLDQMTAPTADVSMNTHKVTNVVDPTSAQDAATKAYVDSLSQGVTWKASVRAATTAAATLATGFENGDTIDGVVLATGNRVLVKDQASGSENGIYVVAASGAPTRATDADVSAEMQGGVATFVQEGTANADSGWVLTNNGAVVLNTTALVFARFTGLSDVLAGNGLTKTGNSIDAVAGATPGSAGSGGGLVANANDLVIDVDVVARVKRFTKGDGVTADIVCNHNLNNRAVQTTVIRAASPYDQIDVYVESTDANNVTIFFPVAPASNEYLVLVVG